MNTPTPCPSIIQAILQEAEETGKWLSEEELRELAEMHARALEKQRADA